MKETQQPKEQKEKTKFEKNGIPRIAFGHMAAPCLMFRAEYSIFRKVGIKPIGSYSKKLVTIFKGAF